ncbi:MAG TPA: helix-turn-helix domain-containing protein [Polyangiaceae bacterium]|nr:helix-turn-helix domain-containing protein [Polyangiaceae bacterium]
MKGQASGPDQASKKATRGVGKPEPQPPELFTAADFAHFCQVDLKTIHNWAEKGEVRHFRTPGRHLRFRRVDILEFLHRFGYPVPEALRSGKPKVVLIDAEPSELAALRKLLGKRFDVTTFAEPFEAVVSLASLLPDVLVMDLEQKGLDMVHFLKRLSAIEATSRVRTVIYSRHAHLERALLEAGAKDFVAKGEHDLLRHALERLTGLGEAPSR